MSESVAGCLAATLAVAIASLGSSDAREQSRDRRGMQFEARVVSIADGDTIELIPIGESRLIRTRLEGIDAPEFGEPFNREATSFARTLLARQRVHVEVRDVDRYGRLVARIKIGGRDASVELLQAGFACHFTQFAVDPVLAAAQSGARASGRGFWASSAQKPRCAAAAVASHFRGNVSSRLYHIASCPNAHCRNCTRTFATESEARAAGFKPAGDCLRR